MLGKAIAADTIYATATGAGRSAIAVVRVSGPACSVLLRRLCPGVEFSERVATYAAIKHEGGEIIDRALVIRFAAPRSFTGEDLVEFQVTGSRAVVSGLLLAIASEPEVRPAQAGEFAQRAFLNGKLDLVEVEGLASLVEAETAAQRRAALRMAGGKLSQQCEGIRGQLLELLATVESLLDFSDVEDAMNLSLDDVFVTLGDVSDSMARLLSREKLTERLQRGMTVVIAGKPNVGKSTLLNTLARRDVAIVSDTPGTTRDLIEVPAEIDGYPVTFVDTAGVRETVDPIEAEGVARARKRAEGADLTLWLLDSCIVDGLANQLSGPTIVVRTKSDLTQCAQSDQAEVVISAHTGGGLEDLVARIGAFARDHFAGENEMILGTARQYGAVREAFDAIERVRSDRDLSLELAAEELRLAAFAMARVSGRIEVEEVLGEIFSRLCVGK